MDFRDPGGIPNGLSEPRVIDPENRLPRPCPPPLFVRVAPVSLISFYRLGIYGNSDSGLDMGFDPRLGRSSVGLAPGQT